MRCWVPRVETNATRHRGRYYFSSSVVLLFCYSYDMIIIAPSHMAANSCLPGDPRSMRCTWVSFYAVYYLPSCSLSSHIILSSHFCTCRMILQLNCIHTTYVRQGPEQRQQLEPDDKEDSESTYEYSVVVYSK
jgi:hypothetical protein